jgi:hypothetical protein
MRDQVDHLALALTTPAHGEHAGTHHGAAELLATVGSREAAFPLPHGRGDQVRGDGGPDPRELPSKGLRTRDIYTPDLHIDTIKVKRGTSTDVAARNNATRLEKPDWSRLLVRRLV